MSRYSSLVFTALAVILLAPPAARAQSPLPGFLHGSPADPQQVQRVVTIQPDTRWVNVTQGESVRFVVGSAQFDWRFDGHDNRSFDLQTVAPPGALTRPVMVYIARSPGRRA